MPLMPRALLLPAAFVSAIGFAAPGFAQNADRFDAGAYLAGRSASRSNDFAAAGQYFQQALMFDPSNPGLLEGALASFVGSGDMDRAAQIATRMADQGIQSQLSLMVLMSENATSGDWGAVLQHQEAGQAIGPLVDGTARAWAHIGEGQMSLGLAAFDEMIEGDTGTKSFALYLKALAQASVGDFEGADTIFSLSPMQGFQRTRRSTIAHAQVLSMLERNDDALALIGTVFGETTDPEITHLRDRLSGGEQVSFTIVNSAQDGLAETLFSVATVLEGETDDFNTLIYARLATDLDPSHTQAILLSARLLENLGRYELAEETFRQVSRDDPAFVDAEMGRAKVLARAGRTDGAIEVLQSLARDYPDHAFLQATLGDTLRQNDRLPEALTAYDRALDLFASDAPVRWFVLYSRAIIHYDLDNWPAAEADFRAALDLNPNEARVLNYLGYSLVERQEKLDEALDMIERAAAARPDSGAIIDSLGWVLFRLGDYEQAVTYLERAASLLPIDPVINDHLGDAYWAVGRDVEARFQWNRALSFDPIEDEATRIRRKLEIGLDQVLSEEGAAPLHLVADSDG